MSRDGTRLARDSLEDMMAIDLNPLLGRAFFRARPVTNATLAIEKAADEFARRTSAGGVSFEVVAPLEPDEEWLERTIGRLVYYCESEGRPIPRCAGVFLSLFVGDALYCVTAEDVVRWAAAELRLEPDELRERYGTHELDTALR